MNKKKLIAIAVSLLVIAAVIIGLAISIKSASTTILLTKDQAQKLVDLTFSSKSLNPTSPLQLIDEKRNITVDSVSIGDEKDLIIDCTVTVPAVYEAVVPHFNDYLQSAPKDSNGMFKSQLKFMQEFETSLCTLIENAEMTTSKCTVTFYEVSGELTLHRDDKVIDVLYGGVSRIIDEVLALDSYTTEENGVKTEHTIVSRNVNKGLADCFTVSGSSDKPDTSTPILRAWNDLKDDFTKNFIDHDRYLTILNGLLTTLELTFCALLIGIVLGFIVAFVRCTHDKLSRRNLLLRASNKICNLYLTVTRGTPVVVQIMIIYFVIFMPVGFSKFWSAVICFGLNSGAYVAEIVRGGIMSIDDGQTEAGRSLGFNYIQTMFYIVFPQAFKAVLPALANEFVVLLKETSVAFYIGLGDLMYAGNSIRAATYSAFMPLVTVAVIYLIMVMGLSKLVNILERRLRNNER